jgi:hypothetical protein
VNYYYQYFSNSNFLRKTAKRRKYQERIRVSESRVKKKERKKERNQPTMSKGAGADAHQHSFIIIEETNIEWVP